MEITNRLAASLSVLCLCVQLSGSQVPPPTFSNSQNNRQQGRQATRNLEGGMACPPSSCPPQWISTLNFYSDLLSPMVMTPVCRRALDLGFISSCNNPQQTCGSNRPGANVCCCPAAQLSKVQDCLPKAQYVCIPDDFTPWQNELQQAIFGSMG